VLPPAGPDRRKTPIRGRWGGPGVVLGQGWSGGGSGQGPRGSVGGRPLQLCDIFDCRSSLSAFLLIRLTFFFNFSDSRIVPAGPNQRQRLMWMVEFPPHENEMDEIDSAEFDESQIMQGKKLLCEHVKVFKLNKSSSVRMYEL